MIGRICAVEGTSSPPIDMGGSTWGGIDGGVRVVGGNAADEFVVGGQSSCH